MPSSLFYTLSLHALFRSLFHRRDAGVRRPRVDRRGARTIGGRIGRSSESEFQRMDVKRRLQSSICNLQFFFLRVRTNKRKQLDRKSTRLNSSHRCISYAVFPVLHSFPTRALPISVSSARCWCSASTCGSAWRSNDWRENRPKFRIGISTNGREKKIAIINLQFAIFFPASKNEQAETIRSEEHTSELQSPMYLVCRLPCSTLFPYTRSSDLCFIGAMLVFGVHVWIGVALERLAGE